MKIEILGSGCAKCKKLFENALSAVKSAGINAEVIKVEDMEKIIAYGIMSTPAIAIDGEVKSAGILLTSDQITKLIKV